MIKIGFFDKMNSSLIFSTVKKQLQRGDGEIFFKCKLKSTKRACWSVITRE